MTLPSGWTYCEVADIAANDHDAITDGPFGSSLKSDHYTCSGVRVIRLGNIGSRRFIGNDEAFVDESRFQELRRHEACAGDLVTAALGEPLGRTAPVPPAYGPAIVKADCFRLRPSARIEKELVLYWLNSPTVLRSFLDRSQGIGRVRINLSTFRTTKLPIPPLAEQRRIVAKLDGLTARISLARAELDRVVKLASRLRQVALARSYKRQLNCNVAPLPIQHYCISIVDGDHQAPPRSESGTAFITISSIRSGLLDLRNASRFVPSEYAESLSAARRPQIGDVLYSVTGSFGIPAIVNTNEPFVFQRHIALLRPNSRLCDTRWLWYMLLSPQVSEQAEAIATGTAQLTVPISGLRKLTLPGADLAEQKQAVIELDAAFARADRLEAEAARAAALIDRLEAAILAKAFQGELVPQDPADEPASVLLDRIRTERAAAPQAKRGRRVVSAASS